MSLLQQAATDIMGDQSQDSDASYVASSDRTQEDEISCATVATVGLIPQDKVVDLLNEKDDDDVPLDKVIDLSNENDLLVQKELTTQPHATIDDVPEQKELSKEQRAHIMNTIFLSKQPKHPITTKHDVDNNSVIDKREGSILLKILHAITTVILDNAISHEDRHTMMTIEDLDKFWLQVAETCPGYLTAQNIQRIITAGTDCLICADPRNQTPLMRTRLKDMNIAVDYVVPTEHLHDIVQITEDIINNVMGEKGPPILGGKGQNIRHRPEQGWNNYDNHPNANMRLVAEQSKKATIKIWKDSAQHCVDVVDDEYKELFASFTNLILTPEHFLLDKPKAKPSWLWSDMKTTSDSPNSEPQNPHVDYDQTKTKKCFSELGFYPMTSLSPLTEDGMMILIWTKSETECYLVFIPLGITVYMGGDTYHAGALCYGNRENERLHFYIVSSDDDTDPIGERAEGYFYNTPRQQMLYLKSKINTHLMASMHQQLLWRVKRVDNSSSALPHIVLPASTPQNSKAADSVSTAKASITGGATSVLDEDVDDKIEMVGEVSNLHNTVSILGAAPGEVHKGNVTSALDEDVADKEKDEQAGFSAPIDLTGAPPGIENQKDITLNANAKEQTKLSDPTRLLGNAPNEANKGDGTTDFDREVGNEERDVQAGLSAPIGFTEAPTEKENAGEETLDDNPEGTSKTPDTISVIATAPNETSKGDGTTALVKDVDDTEKDVQAGLLAGVPPEKEKVGEETLDDNPGEHSKLPDTTS